LAQVRKPPDVAQAHAVSDNTEEELHFPAPRCPVLLLGILAVDNILTRRHRDRHVLARLAIVVQGSQLVPVSRSLALYHHLLESPDEHADNRSPHWSMHSIEIFSGLLKMLLAAMDHPRLFHVSLALLVSPVIVVYLLSCVHVFPALFFSLSLSLSLSLSPSVCLSVSPSFLELRGTIRQKRRGYLCVCSSRCSPAAEMCQRYLASVAMFADSREREREREDDTRRMNTDTECTITTGM